MNHKAIRGIALLLFGLLLCASGPELNLTLFYNFGDFPFAITGLIVGAVGLIMVFDATKGEE